MRTLLTDDVEKYCGGTAEEREASVERLTQPLERPSCLLPVLELCHAIHFGVRDQGLDPREFRDCWERFVEQVDSGWDDQGTAVALLECVELEDTIEAVMRSRPEDSSAEEDEEREEGPRRRGGQVHRHRSLVTRLRDLYNDALERLEASPWSVQRPGTLPVFDPDSSDNPDVVIDTNNLIELLDVLDLSGGSARLRVERRLGVRSVRRFNRALLSNGLAGKIIIPISVLEETDRVARVHAQKYARVTQRLREIAVDPDRMPWGAFAIESISLDVFAAFLGLHEVLFNEPEAKWPGFADALVLAHGLHNECSVASTEWYERYEEKDWKDVGRLFPFLVEPRE